jgi:hypothetical protein
MMFGDGELRELAKMHVASLISRPGLRRVVDLARDAAVEALPKQSATRPPDPSRTQADN